MHIILLRLGLFFGLVCAGCADRPLFFPGGPNGGGNGNNGNGGNGGDGGLKPGDPGYDPNNPNGNGPPKSPRLIGPLSTATVTSQQPRLRWDMTGVAGAAEVDLCADRACQTARGHATVDGSGAAATPDAALPPGPLFWRVRAGAQVSATWEFFVGHRSAPADTSYGATLDLDGDGVPDVATSAASGDVAVYLGGVAGLARAPLVLANPDGKKSGFGFVLAAAGDLNGDGYGDLAIGECGGAGGVRVYFGGPAGPPTASSQALVSPDGMSGFGCRVTGAGDLDGDGYADLAVARVGGDVTGGLYIYKGGPQGVPATTTRIDSPVQKPSRLGYSLAGVGDLDGDGFADLAATEIDYSDLTGQVHLYRGGPDGISNQRVVTIKSPDPIGVQYGSSVACAGDVDGDGYPDFVIGAPAVPTVKFPPKVHLYLGGAGGPSASATPIDLPTDGANGFGTEVEGAGDLDGDGYSDVVVTSQTGLVVFRGAAGGIAPAGTSVDAAGQGSNPRHLASAGDLDGDGTADVLIEDGAGVEALLGAAGGLARSRPGAVIVVAPPAGASGFGGAVVRKTRLHQPTEDAHERYARARGRTTRQHGGARQAHRFIGRASDGDGDRARRLQG